MKKLNVIDIFIILFVVLALVGVGARMVADAYLDEKNNSEYLVKVKIASVDSAKENAVAVNDEVYLEGVAEVFGKIESVKARNYMPDTATENSGVVMEALKCDLICTIEVRGVQTEKGFILESGQYLYSGMDIEIKTTGYEGSCRIMGITTKK